MRVAVNLHQPLFTCQTHRQCFRPLCHSLNIYLAVLNTRLAERERVSQSVINSAEAAEPQS